MSQVSQPFGFAIVKTDSTTATSRGGSGRAPTEYLRMTVVDLTPAMKKFLETAPKDVKESYEKLVGERAIIWAESDLDLDRLKGRTFEGTFDVRNKTNLTLENGDQRDTWVLAGLTSVRDLPLIEALGIQMALNAKQIQHAIANPRQVTQRPRPTGMNPVQEVLDNAQTPVLPDVDFAAIK